LDTIRAFSRQEQFSAENIEKVSSFARAWIPVTAAEGWLQVRLQMVGSLLIGAASLFSVLSRGYINTSLAAIALVFSLDLTGSLSWYFPPSLPTPKVLKRVIRFMENLSSLENSMVSVERVLEYLQLPSEEEESSSLMLTEPPRDWPTTGAIEFEGVSMRYHGTSDDVIKDISVKFSPGEKIGIVGRTGAGKSSLIVALFRLEKLSKGRILIDGIDIKSMSLKSLRSKVAIIPQEPTLFAGSLRSNL
jgi:ABC-type multidrug transport system fused ATPase/permease subunit